MSREKTFFGFGLVLGVVIAVLFLFYFAPRYTILKTDGKLLKEDRWSGRSWRLVGNRWMLIESASRNWKKIDDALAKALGIASSNMNRAGELALLRKKNPVLKDLSDDELLERIKLVYSKQILCNMYLDSLAKAEKK